MSTQESDPRWQRAILEARIAELHRMLEAIEDCGDLDVVELSTLASEALASDYAIERVLKAAEQTKENVNARPE
ncbi:MAG: hypothetical protein KAY24_19515 [Candidatus Eisenbacteria sp.]|nr:hypothetical protein [Candidatus Eisenbacteria bacterium]